MFRALTRRVNSRWRFVSFRGRAGGEWRGVVDVLAVRKASRVPPGAVLKRGDLFEFILIQLKGGDAPGPSADDVRRLRLVQRRLGARAVVLYSWKRRAHSVYRKLAARGNRWQNVSARSLFG
jgi:hypothetical protein